MPRPSIKFKSKNLKNLVDTFYIGKKAIKSVEKYEIQEISKKNNDSLYETVFNPVENVIRTVKKHFDENKISSKDYEEMLSQRLQSLGGKTKEHADIVASLIMADSFNPNNFKDKKTGENDLNKAYEQFQTVIDDDLDIVCGFFEDYYTTDPSFNLEMLNDKIGSENVNPEIKGNAKIVFETEITNNKIKELSREKSVDELMPAFPTQKDLDDLKLSIEDAKFKKNVADQERYTEELSKKQKNFIDYNFDKKELNKYLEADTFNSNDNIFKERMRELVARLVKDDSSLKLVTAIYLDKKTFKDNYELAAEYVNTLLMRTNFISEPVENLAQEAKEKYDDIPLENIKRQSFNERKDREKIREFFANCQTPEQYKEAMERFLDGVCENNPVLFGFQINEEISHGPKNLQSAFYIADLLKKDSKDPNFSLEANGLTFEFLKDLAESKIDAADAAKEYSELFKSQLILRDENRLGVPENKENDFVKEAVSTYAKLNDIHSKRDFWHMIFHPFKHYAEYSALKNMEDVLKGKLKFTNAELQDIKANEKTNSQDPLNMEYLKHTNINKYNALQTLKDKNDERRAFINKRGLGAYEKGYFEKMNDIIQNPQKYIEEHNKQQKPEINEPIKEEKVVVEEPIKEAKNPIEEMNKAIEGFKKEKENSYVLLEQIAYNNHHVNIEEVLRDTEKYKDLYMNYYRKDEEFRSILASKELTEKMFDEKLKNDDLIGIGFKPEKGINYEEKAVLLKQDYLIKNAGKVGLTKDNVKNMFNFEKANNFMDKMKEEDEKQFVANYKKEHPEVLSDEEKIKFFREDLQSLTDMEKQSQFSGRKSMPNAREIQQEKKINNPEIQGINKNK